MSLWYQRAERYLQLCEGPPEEDLQGLADALEQSTRQARERWPDLVLEADLFVGFLAERQPRDRNPVSFLAGRPHADLYLACACLQAVDGAAARFLDTYGQEIRNVMVRISNSKQAAEDGLHDLYEKLFMPVDDLPARITHYNGHGELRPWLRVVAARMAIDSIRKTMRQASLHESLLTSLNSESRDAEWQILREQQADAFKNAFASALAQLTPRERNLLRYSVIERLTADQVARIFCAHRVTVARWLSAVRNKILLHIRRALRTKLRLSDSEVDSMVRGVERDLSLSLERLLT